MVMWIAVSVLQCEKQLLRAMDIERTLCVRTRQNCVVEENTLYQLEQQIDQTTPSFEEVG